LDGGLAGGLDERFSATVLEPVLANVNVIGEAGRPLLVRAGVELHQHPSVDPRFQALNS
jgi:hypothetical protein